MKFTKEKETETMTTEGHCMGSEESHNKINKKGIKKEIQEECKRELLELERDIWCFERHIQVVVEETQSYGWVMRKRNVRWNSLQVKLRKKIYARLKEELREDESEIEVSYCEPEQGPFLKEDDEIDEEIIDDFLNSHISSEPHEHNMDKTPYEKYCVF